MLPRDGVLVVRKRARRAEDRVGQALLRLGVVAVGEIGLDYHYDHSPRETQKQVLIRQMEIARAAKLPIVIHCRDAWPDLTEITASHWSSSGL